MQNLFRRVCNEKLKNSNEDLQKLDMFISPSVRPRIAQWTLIKYYGEKVPIKFVDKF
jgi:hypothetical protein